MTFTSILAVVRLAREYWTIYVSIRVPAELSLMKDENGDGVKGKHTGQVIALLLTAQCCSDQA